MCVVSMVGDHYRDKWESRPYFPDVYPVMPAYPNPNIEQQITGLIPSFITREEFDQLRAEVQEMKELLIRAKKYDEDNNEPHCEIEEKMEILRKMAAVVGIDLDDVIGNSGN